MNESLTIGDRKFYPGERGVVDLPVGRLVSHAELDLRVHVFRGKKPGPRLFVTAGVHGDELNGVEIARKLIAHKFRGLKGDLFVVPVVNVAAFLLRSRYLPDRRDLNRLFPGNADGSFGSRIARTLMDEVVGQCSHGIDLHTAAGGRINLPQTRMADRVPGSREMAKAFGAPVMLKAGIRDGSLRASCENKKMPYVLFEAGEALRLDLPAVTFGARGVIRVMRHLEMLPARKKDQELPSAFCDSSRWVRAGVGGIFRALIPLGRAVEVGQVLGVIGDPMGNEESEVRSDYSGIVLGRTTGSLVDEGDALFHIGQTRAAPERAEERITRSAEEVLPDLDRPIFRDAHADQ